MYSFLAYSSYKLLVRKNHVNFPQNLIGRLTKYPSLGLLSNIIINGTPFHSQRSLELEINDMEIL